MCCNHLSLTGVHCKGPSSYYSSHGINWWCLPLGKSETLAVRAHGSSHGCYGDFWKSAGAASALKAQQQARAKSCQWLLWLSRVSLTASALICTDGVPCSGSSQSPLICKGRCRWTHPFVTLQSREPETQSACMWGILGHPLDLCSLGIVVLFSSLWSEDFCLGLGTNLLQFLEKCLCKASFEQHLSEQHLSEEIIFIIVS